jgi:hypothetical protein
VEWRSVKPTPIQGRIDASAVSGEGGGRNCFQRFSGLAARGGQKLSPSHRNTTETWLNALASYSKPLSPRDQKRGTDSRFEDVIRISAEYCERRADAEGQKDLPSFASLPIPNFRYFPTHLWEKQGPKQWARLRFLQACERLNIPSDRWPKFTRFELPREQEFRYITNDQFVLPPFQPLYESETEWQQRAQRLFEKFIGMHAARFRAWFKEELDKGTVTKVKPVRDTTPLDLRYEWAAKRICYNTPFRELAQQEAAKGYTEHRIRQAVKRIITETGLRQGK